MSRDACIHLFIFIHDWYKTMALQSKDKNREYFMEKAAETVEFLEGMMQ